MNLVCNNQTLDLSRPVVMGVLNVTPDSFSDGGRYASLDNAVQHARQLFSEGAAILDIGGESTRPGAEPVSLDQELQRVIPVIEAIRLAGITTPISIDTSKPEVMRAAVAAGAGMINDVCALQQPGALQAAADAGVAVCLMHMQGDPQKMQDNPQYDSVTGDIMHFLEQRIAACVEAGIPRERIVLDPGFGFGKTQEQNYTLLAELQRIGTMGLPVLVGLSRKSMIGAVLDAGVDQRLYGSLAAAVIAVMSGANIVRVHDVGATIDAIKVCMAVMMA